VQRLGSKAQQTVQTVQNVPNVLTISKVKIISWTAIAGAEVTRVARNFGSYTTHNFSAVNCTGEICISFFSY
jgi:hypothetical protein